MKHQFTMLDQSDGFILEVGTKNFQNQSALYIWTLLQCRMDERVGYPTTDINSFFRFCFSGGNRHMRGFCPWCSDPESIGSVVSSAGLALQGCSRKPFSPEKWLLKIHLNGWENKALVQIIWETLCQLRITDSYPWLHGTVVSALKPQEN